MVCVTLRRNNGDQFPVYVEDGTDFVPVGGWVRVFNETKVLVAAFNEVHVVMARVVDRAVSSTVAANATATY